MKFYFDTVNDSNLVPPALIVANYKSSDKISTSKLISEIRLISEIPDEDKKILKHRSDDKFSQKVRNLISHKVLEKYNLAVSSKNNIELTKHGKSIGKLIRENFIGDKINIKKIIQNDKYQRSLLKAKLNLNFDPFYLMKLTSCDFSQRSLSLFKNLNLVYIGDLISNTNEFEIMKTPNVGSKTVVEINNFLKKNNLSFKINSDWNLVNDKKSLYQTYIRHISKNFSSNNIDEIISSYLMKYKKESDLMFNRRKKIIKLRMCLEGEFSTLDALGKEFNVERERIRQIQSKFCKNLINKENFKFALNKLLKFLSENTPIGENYLNDKLQKENYFNSFKSLTALRTLISGFTKYKFDNQTITNNNYNLDNDDLSNVDEKTSHDEEFLVSSKREVKELNKIVSESRKMTTRYSFCNFNKLIYDVFKVKNYSRFENIKNSLKKHSNFIWLDDENFMTLDTSDQTIMKRLNKLLFIHKKISFEDFQAALLNDHRIRTSPPLKLIKKICEINNFKSDDNFIYFSGKKPEFNNLEDKIIKLFLENGNYLTYWEGLNLVPKYSLKPGSFAAYMYGSYLIKKLDKVFFLAGTEIQDSKIAQVKERAEKESKNNDPNLEINWTNTKKVRVKFKATQLILTQGFIRYIPSQWHNILEGIYYNLENKSKVQINIGIWNLKEILNKFKKDDDVSLEFSFNPNIVKIN